MLRAVFLDRDGTINKEAGYISDKRKLKLYPNAGRAIKILSRAGFKIIVVTNQSGVGRGLVKKSELDSITRKIKDILGKYGANIDAFYICPHRPDDNCPCRKPKTGLVEKARKDFNLEVSSSYIIGDKISDIELGRNAGFKEGILLLTGFGRRELKKARESGFKLGHVSRDILSAARHILKIESF